MLDARIFDTMAQQLGKLLPPGVDALKSDFEKNARSVLQSSLAKMDLVTREEFDVQSALLQKTALKVKELEKRLTALEPATDSEQ